MDASRAPGMGLAERDEATAQLLRHRGSAGEGGQTFAATAGDVTPGADLGVRQLTTRFETAFLQMSVSPSFTFFARARYLPECVTPRMR